MNVHSYFSPIASNPIFTESNHISKLGSEVMREALQKNISQALWIHCLSSWFISTWKSLSFRGKLRELRVELIPFTWFIFPICLWATFTIFGFNQSFRSHHIEYMLLITKSTFIFIIRNNLSSRFPSKLFANQVARSYH